LKAKYDTALITGLCPVIGLQTKEQQARFARLYGFIITVMIACFEERRLPELPGDMLGIVFSYFCRDYGDAPAFHTKRARNINEPSGYNYRVIDGPNPHVLYGLQPVAQRTLVRAEKRQMLQDIRHLKSTHTGDSLVELDCKEEYLKHEANRYNLKYAKKEFKRFVELDKIVNKAKENLDKVKSEEIKVYPHMNPKLVDYFVEMKEATKTSNIAFCTINYENLLEKRNRAAMKYYREKEDSIIGADNKRSYRGSIRKEALECNISVDLIYKQAQVTELYYSKLFKKHLFSRVCKQVRNREFSEKRCEQRREERAKRREVREKKESIEYFNTLLEKKKQHKKKK
jgi:hypothetical protein